MLPQHLIFWALISLILPPAMAESLHSFSTRVSLLELYTSEGCSSCPPADRWMSTLKKDPRLWKQIIPVAFHVDYWDYIGWKDRFASPIYGQRQRDYANNNMLRTVYTPGFVLDGEEWRRWFGVRKLALEEPSTVGSLNLEINGATAEAKFTPTKQQPENLELHVALLGFDLSSAVKAGENRGRQLEHDFIVLGYERITLTRNDDTYQSRFTMPKPRVTAPRTALAAWVTRDDHPRPIQAVGGWLSGS